jgi:hypothetical protein
MWDRKNNRCCLFWWCSTICFNNSVSKFPLSYIGIFIALAAGIAGAAVVWGLVKVPDRQLSDATRTSSSAGIKISV